MDNALAVGEIDGTGKLGDQLGRPRRQQLVVGKIFGQVAALDVLQREVRPAQVFPGLVDLHDVGMRQPRRRLRLGTETGQGSGPGQLARQDHLDGHEAFQPGLEGLEHDPHASPT